MNEPRTGTASGHEAGDPQGHVPLQAGAARAEHAYGLTGSGAILNEVIAAANLLKRLERRGRHLELPELRCWRARAAMSRAGTLLHPAEKPRALLTSRSA